MVTAVDFPECYTSIDAASIRAVSVDTEGRPGQIEVKGYTRGCLTMVFEIASLSGVAPVTVLGSPPAGRRTQWVPFTATFNLNHQYEVCGRDITVTARCADDANCEQRITVTLPCEGCPTVDNLSATALGCEQLNTRFRLRATVQGFRPPGTRVFWQFGDGPTSRSADLALIGANGVEVVEVEHSYAQPGPYLARLQFATRPACAGAEVVVPANQFLDCVSDTPNCPTLTALARPDANSACDDRGRRNVTFTVNTTALPAPKLAYWEFGDGDFSAPFNLLLGANPDASHLYDIPGSYQATLHITDCPSRSLTVNVTAACPPVPPPPAPPPNADCPSLLFSATVAGDCDASGRRSATLTGVVQSAPTPKAAVLDFGDGSTPSDGFIVAGQSFAIEHLYAAGARYTARLTVEGCGSQEVVVDASAQCADVPPPLQPTLRPTEETGQVLCEVLLSTALACMFFGLVLLLVGCVLEHVEPAIASILMTLGGVLLVVGWILFGLWWLFCSAVTACSVILSARDVVGWLILLFAFIAIVLGLFALGDPLLWPCFAIALAAGLNWGVVRVVIDWIAEDRGCLIQNPGRNAARARRTPPPGVGLGSRLTKVTSAIGIKPCGGCRARATTLDRWTAGFKSPE
jgi:hypothetical protein